MMRNFRSNGTKYNSRKIERDGMTFDSIKEYRRFCELSLLEKAGKVTDLQRQVKFVLIPSQRINGKVVERACSYVADFVYQIPVHEQYDTVEGHPVFADGYETVVEDTKGFKTKDYIIKRKLMLHVHGIRIHEI